MKGKDLLQAMDGIDDAFVSDALAERKLRRRWLPALAACLAIVLLLAALLPAPAVTPLPDFTDHTGIALRWEGEEPQGGGKYSIVAPQGGFHMDPVVVARAVEVLPETYEDLPTYGAFKIRRWRIFRMEIIDPLDSGLSGEFLFGLPEEYYQDLTTWDTLLLSLYLHGLDYTLRSTADSRLVTIDRFYCDPNPYHGNTVAFTDGVFDKSLWKHELWAYPKFFPISAYEALQRNKDFLLVQEGFTLDDTLAEMEARRAEDGYTPDDPTVPQAVLDAMESLDDSFLGTGFDYIIRNGKDVRHIRYTRYLGGCMTNEYALIHPQTGEIVYSDTHFEGADLENLPDLYTYVMDLDWDELELVPDENRGELLYRAMYGWYEKTEDGVLAFVKVTWYHESETGMVVYDDMYFMVTVEGGEILNRQQMRNILGEGNDNLPHSDREGPLHYIWK